MKPASGKRMRAWAGTRFSNFQLANSGHTIRPPFIAPPLLYSLGYTPHCSSPRTTSRLPIRLEPSTRAAHREYILAIVLVNIWPRVLDIDQTPLMYMMLQTSRCKSFYLVPTPLEYLPCESCNTTRTRPHEQAASLYRQH